jgi:hypothetical protein
MSGVRNVAVRGTTAEWTSSNPLLKNGEWGLDTTVRRVKIGDGINVWSDLPWLDAALQITESQITDLDKYTQSQVDAAITEAINNAGIIGDHNDLNGLQGGDVGEFYHLTLEQYTKATQIASATQDGLLSKEDHAAFSAKLDSVSEEDVTQHQAALEITESQITDLDKYTQSQVDAAIEAAITEAGVIQDHNELEGLQGGIVDEYFHLTEDQHTEATQYVDTEKNGLMLASDFTFFDLMREWFNDNVVIIKTPEIQTSETVGSDVVFSFSAFEMRLNEDQHHATDLEVYAEGGTTPLFTNYSDTNNKTSFTIPISELPPGELEARIRFQGKVATSQWSQKKSF